MKAFEQTTSSIQIDSKQCNLNILTKVPPNRFKLKQPKPTTTMTCKYMYMYRSRAALKHKFLHVLDLPNCLCIPSIFKFKPNPSYLNYSTKQLETSK